MASDTYTVSFTEKDINAEFRGIRGVVQHLRDETRERFDQVDGRFAQIDDRFAQIDDRFAQIDDRFAQIDDRFAQIDDRFAQVDDRFVQVDRRFDAMETKFDTMETKFDTRFFNFSAQMSNGKLTQHHQTIRPLAYFNRNTSGEAEVTTPGYFPYNVRQYWKLRETSQHHRLVYLLRFYHLGPDLQNLIDEEKQADDLSEGLGVEEEEGSDDNNSPLRGNPASSPETVPTLEAMVTDTPDFALKVLGNYLGLDFEAVRDTIQQLQYRAKSSAVKASTGKRAAEAEAGISETSKRIAIRNSPPLSLGAKIDPESMFLPPSHTPSYKSEPHTIYSHVGYGKPGAPVSPSKKLVDVEPFHLVPSGQLVNEPQPAGQSYYLLASELSDRSAQPSVQRTSPSKKSRASIPQSKSSRAQRDLKTDSDPGSPTQLLSQSRDAPT